MCRAAVVLVCATAVAFEALLQGLEVSKYFMFNAAVPSEALDAPMQDADVAVRAKYVPCQVLV